MTAEKMRTLCVQYGFEVLQQSDAMDDGRVSIYQASEEGNPDVITVFAKCG